MMSERARNVMTSLAMRLRRRVMSLHVLADRREVEPGRLRGVVLAEVLDRQLRERAVAVQALDDLVDARDERPDGEPRLLVDVAGLVGVVRGLLELAQPC